MNDASPSQASLAQPNPSRKLLMNVMSWVVVVMLTLFCAVSLYRFSNVHKTAGDFWLTLIREQFPVVVGLPMAGFFSLFVTIVLKFAAGPIEVEIAGLKFKGAAAPIVFWVVCYLSIAISIRLLWQ